MRLPLALLAFAAALPGGTALGASPESSSDAVLASLVAEARARSPDLARARATLRAEEQRAPQAGALPDPLLSIGIQNDGFQAIQIGKMETSYWQVMATQSLPWPGKRGAREETARAQARLAGAQVARVELSLVAEVERAYLELLRSRDRLRLQERLESLWTEAEAIARTRYEVGQGSQSDLIRAQLERTRLRQQRASLESAERQRLHELNRLRVRPLDEPLATSQSLADLADPELPSPAESVADAERRSPDLAQAELSLAAAGGRVAQAEKDRYPDLSVTAGIMPRGALDPMWLASVGISLPVFWGSKQAPALAESRIRQEAEVSGRDGVAQLVRLRARERQSLLAATLEANRLYRGGLLVQSDSAVQSTLGQYRVGKATFAAVLDVLRGRVADEAGYLDSIAEAQRVAIASREVSLDPPGAAGGLGSGAIPGAASMGGGKAATAAASSTQQPAASGGMTPGM